MLESFNKVSNPLTIIALFAGLAEVCGTAVLPLISEQNQSTYLIFLITFPCLLVTLFFLTLNFNNQVLYAPSDFNDESNFIKLMNRQINEVEVRLAKTVSKELDEKVTKLEDNLTHKDYLKRAKSLFDQEKYNESLDEIQSALKIKQSSYGYGLMARVYYKKSMYSKAIQCCSKGLDINDNDTKVLAILYWNRACYQSLDKGNVGLVVTDLRQAILHNMELSDNLMDEEDLVYIRNTKEFKSFAKEFLGD